MSVETLTLRLCGKNNDLVDLAETQSAQRNSLNKILFCFYSFKDFEYYQKFEQEFYGLTVMISRITGFIPANTNSTAMTININPIILIKTLLPLSPSKRRIFRALTKIK